VAAGVAHHCGGRGKRHALAGQEAGSAPVAAAQIARQALLHFGNIRSMPAWAMRSLDRKLDHRLLLLLKSPGVSLCTSGAPSEVSNLLTTHFSNLQAATACSTCPLWSTATRRGCGTATSSLDSFLICLFNPHVAGGAGGDGVWHVPFLEHSHTETVREAAERALQHHTGGGLRTHTLGNPPAAHHPR